MEEMLSKKKIRREIRVRRAALKETKKAELDAAVQRQALDLLMKEMLQGGQSGSVYSYVSFGGETDTRKLLSEFWIRKIPVAVPRVDGSQIDFYRVYSMEDLEPGFHGILEPGRHCAEAQDSSALVIVPGAAFTEAGGRLGYGGGFYDRFFKREPGHKRIALAYEFQIMEGLPLEAHDAFMDMVVTERRILNPGRKEQQWN